MALHSVDYEHVRANAEIGDVVAFGGDSLLSKLIKVFMGAPVSHAGAILSSATGEGGDPELIESTVLPGKGEFTIAVRSLGQVVDDYDGDVWWLPKSDTVSFDPAKFDVFLREQVGKLFDVGQGIGVVVGEMLDTILGREVDLMPEDLSSFFCSELVAEAFEKAGTIPDVNSSEVSPKDLCRWAIYEQDYFYINGGSTGPTIDGYNSVDPSGASSTFEFASFVEVEAFQPVLPELSFVNEQKQLREGLVFATQALESAGRLDAVRELQGMLPGSLELR